MSYLFNNNIWVTNSENQTTNDKDIFYFIVSAFISNSIEKVHNCNINFVMISLNFGKYSSTIRNPLYLLSSILTTAVHVTIITQRRDK